MFHKYRVVNGPAGMESSYHTIKRTDWKLYKRPSDGSPDYVEDGEVIYRFSKTFIDSPDRFYIHLHSSEDHRGHVFQEVSRAQGGDSAQILHDRIIYFRSDRVWHPPEKNCC